MENLNGAVVSDILPRIPLTLKRKLWQAGKDNISGKGKASSNRPESTRRKSSASLEESVIKHENTRVSCRGRASIDSIRGGGGKLKLKSTFGVRNDVDESDREHIKGETADRPLGVKCQKGRGEGEEGNPWALLMRYCKRRRD